MDRTEVRLVRALVQAVRWFACYELDRHEEIIHSWMAQPEWLGFVESKDDLGMGLALAPWAFRYNATALASVSDAQLFQAVVHEMKHFIMHHEEANPPTPEQRRRDQQEIDTVTETIERMSEGTAKKDLN